MAAIPLFNEMMACDVFTFTFTQDPRLFWLPVLYATAGHGYDPPFGITSCFRVGVWES